MIRLSRRGWNNVLIFACLILIMVFDQSVNLIGSKSTQGSQSLLPSDHDILRIDYGSHQLQRIGQGWRIQPSLSLSEPRLREIIHFWGTAEGELMPTELEDGYLVVVWLAGEPNGRAFKLRTQGKDVLVRHKKNVIRLRNTPLSQLIPEALH